MNKIKKKEWVTLLTIPFLCALIIIGKQGGRRGKGREGS
jgi:hypothetical protein